MNHRCSICNKTDNGEVATELGDYTNDPFFLDPNNSNYDICLGCFEVIRDTLDEYDDDEEEDEAFDFD